MWASRHYEKYPRHQYLQRISVTDKISPSQFHTDAAGALLQHRPHRRELVVFCSFAMSRSVPPSERCCLDPLLLTASTYPVSSSSSPRLVPQIASYPSSSLPPGREKRTALTRWTSTNGKSNYKREKRWRRCCSVMFQSPALFQCDMWLCPYLVLCARVPVEEFEKPQRVTLPHQDEVARSVCQVGRGREAQRTSGTWAGHASERHTPEPAFHSHPFTWRDRQHFVWVSVFSLLYIQTLVWFALQWFSRGSERWFVLQMSRSVPAWELGLPESIFRWIWGVVRWKNTYQSHNNAKEMGWN